jgi:cation diffusion facilitator CzcD-associated flavoprotein CzcO
MALNVKQVDALVMGGGFSGSRLLQLLHSKLHLEKVVAIEKGSALGGTW